ncbi:MAG: hypothetical protein LC808_26195, partial [Actinobacteria bacterium]|nr:hypothetical protein [Actinomycetota bacterium]
MSKYLVGWAAALVLLTLQLPGRGGDPDAKNLVVTALKASGGEAKVGPLKAGSCKAKANIQDANQQIGATLDITWQGYDQYRIVVAAEVMGATKNLVLVINGEKAWAKDADNNQTKDAPKEAAPMITASLYALRMPQLLPALLDKEV